MNVIEKLQQTVSKADESLDDAASKVRQAWYTAVGDDTGSWVREVYGDYVIVCTGNAGDWKVPYARDDDSITFDASAAVEVEQEWVAKTVAITKADPERQVAFGWAYVMNKAGQEVTDHSGEFLDDVAVLEDAAYLFNLDYREGDERHTEAVKAQLIESFLVTPEKLEAMGLAKDALPTGWWTGWYIDDPEVFGKVKSGEYSMLSIGGWAERELVGA